MEFSRDMGDLELIFHGLESEVEQPRIMDIINYYLFGHKVKTFHSF